VSSETGQHSEIGPRPYRGVRNGEVEPQGPRLPRSASQKLL